MAKRRGRTPTLGVKLSEYYAIRLTAPIRRDLEDIAKMVKVPSPVIVRRAIFTFLEALGRGDEDAIAWVNRVRENGEELR